MSSYFTYTNEVFDQQRNALEVYRNMSPYTLNALNDAAGQLQLTVDRSNEALIKLQKKIDEGDGTDDTQEEYDSLSTINEMLSERLDSIKIAMKFIEEDKNQ